VTFLHGVYISADPTAKSESLGYLRRDRLKAIYLYQVYSMWRYCDVMILKTTQSLMATGSAVFNGLETPQNFTCCLFLVPLQLSLLPSVGWEMFYKLESLA